MWLMESPVNPRLMFSHNVPDTEPAVGTVAEFRSAFLSGAGAGSGMLASTELGWADSPSGRDARSRKSLTDLDTINAAILKENPASKANFGAVNVRIIAHPGNFRTRFVELESAVYSAAERLGIPTRVFRTGIGTQDVHPPALNRELESQLAASRDRCTSPTGAGE